MDGKQPSTDDEQHMPVFYVMCYNICPLFSGTIYARYLVAVDRIWYYDTLDYAEPSLVSFIGARLRSHHLPSEK